MTTQVPMIIAIGNAMRGDDAVALHVADELRALGHQGVQTCDGDLVDLLDRWSGVAELVVIDAVVTGAAPGTLHEFDVSRTGLPVACQPSSSHIFSLAQVFEMARALGRLPARVLVIAIEIARVEHGTSMHPEVVAAIPGAVACVCAVAQLPVPDTNHA